ncbi:MAG: DUF2508 family protein [Ruminococcaceae bacterium]|nr:DUF2508 family protein [Oscillospiraceae bacterium]
MKNKREINELCLKARDTRTQLMCMRSYFNEITDPNLISACIYEMNAIEAQYSHIINQAKVLGITGETELYEVRKG